MLDAELLPGRRQIIRVGETGQNCRPGPLSLAPSLLLGPELPLIFMTLIKSHPILWRQSQLLIRPRYLSRHCFFNSNGQTWSPAYPALIPPPFDSCNAIWPSDAELQGGNWGASATSLCISSRHARPPSDMVCLFNNNQPSDDVAVR